MRPVLVLAVALVAVLGLSFARPGRERVESPTARQPVVVVTPAPDLARPRRPARSVRPVRRARCPEGAANCAAVVGRVLYVEAVDADGDGDAHYVLAGGNVTAPGLSVIDVGIKLRPRRLPQPGDQVSAAGPVYTGSYGQKQIEATEIHHRRR